MPKVPMKSSVRSSFVGLSIITLRLAAKQRGLKIYGSRTRVLGRLKEDENRKALKRYQVEMRVHSETMERHNKDLAAYITDLEAYNKALNLWETTQRSKFVQS